LKLDTHYLLDRWHEGDRASLDALVERHLPWIRNHVRNRLGPALRGKAETGDYVQDVVVEVLHYTPRFRVENDRQFRALLVRIVENNLRDRHDWFTARRRDIARDPPLGNSTVLGLSAGSRCHSPSMVVDREEREAWVRLGIEVLEPHDREVIVLREWDRLSFPAIGERLGIDRSAAHKRFSRALDRLTKVVWSLRRGDLDAALGTMVVS